MSKHCLICGLPISRASVRETLNDLLSRLTRDQGAWLLTLNTEMLSRFTRDPSYRELVAQADIITADGMPLVWASRFICPKNPIKERTTGVDLVDAYLRLQEVPPFAVIGGVEPAQALKRYGQAATEACGYLFTGLVDMSDEQIQMFADTLEEKGIRVVFLALGVPKQDRLALKLRAQIPGLLIAGVGGTFEILGPQGSRAPRWMQRSGLEWLFRLLKEPGRLWKRYLLHYPAGLSLLLKDTINARLRPPP